LVVSLVAFAIAIAAVGESLVLLLDLSNMLVGFLVIVLWYSLSLPLLKTANVFVVGWGINECLVAST
jgi:hypothetical protein